MIMRPNLGPACDILHSISLKCGHVIKGASENSIRRARPTAVAVRPCCITFIEAFYKSSTQPEQNNMHLSNSANVPLGRPLWPEHDPHLFVRVDSSVEREIYIWKVFH